MGVLGGDPATGLLLVFNIRVLSLTLGFSWRKIGNFVATQGKAASPVPPGALLPRLYPRMCVYIHIYVYIHAWNQSRCNTHCVYMKAPWLLPVRRGAGSGRHRWKSRVPPSLKPDDCHFYSFKGFPPSICHLPAHPYGRHGLHFPENCTFRTNWFW